MIFFFKNDYNSSQIPKVYVRKCLLVLQIEQVLLFQVLVDLRCKGINSFLAILTSLLQIEK